MTPEERSEFCDIVPLTGSDALSIIAVAVAGLRYDMAALVSELRELRYAVERSR